MAHIRTLSNGSFRAEIRHHHDFIQSKTFPAKKKAQTWSLQFEDNIAAILKLKPKKLKKLKPHKVEALGGRELFNKLGIELNFITLELLADEYIKQWPGKDKNQLFRALYWLEEFKETPIQLITKKMIKKAILRLANSGMFATDGSGRRTKKKRSSNTVMRYKVVLSAMFKYAIEQDYLKKNPVDGITVKATPNKIERYLSEDERDLLLKACKQSSWDRLYLLVTMAITTGMRRGELLNLRWTDIDFDRSLAKLATTKNGSPRINPIPTPAMDELSKFREVGNGYIFYSPYKPHRPIKHGMRTKESEELNKQVNSLIKDSKKLMGELAKS